MKRWAKFGQGPPHANLDKIQKNSSIFFDVFPKYTNLKDTAGQSARGNGNNPLEVVFDGVPNVHIISNEGMIKGKRFRMLIVEIS